jgi:hypothetical protein
MTAGMRKTIRWEEEPAPLLVRGARAVQIIDASGASAAQETGKGNPEVHPQDRDRGNAQGELVDISTNTYGHVEGDHQHTDVTREAALRYGLKRMDQKQVRGITSPTGVTVRLETDCYVFIQANNSQRRAVKILAHEVESIE